MMSSATTRGFVQLALRSQRSYSVTSARRARFLASDKIEGVCAATFQKLGHTLDEKPGISKDELISIIGDYDGLVVRSATKVTPDVIAAGKKLKVIGRAGTGVDNISIPAATENNIFVVNTPGGNTISAAELSMTHICSLARHVYQGAASMKAGRWDRSKYTGIELAGKTVGVIGTGLIGRTVASYCKGFSMSTIGFDPAMPDNAIAAHGITPVSFDELLAKSDFITIHSPFTPQTKDLLNASALAKCKKGVRIINCARGGIINEADLLAALNSGHVGAAALDTLEQEPPKEQHALDLVAHPNLVMTPHLGASTVDAQERVAEQVAVNMHNVLNGSSLFGVCNPPEADATMPKSKPVSTQFSSGPCKKHPGYNLDALPTDSLGRSHRSKIGKERLKEAIDKTKKILKIPEDYHVGIVPASDTGAFEMAMWSMLGQRPVDVCHWESFGKGWYDDVTKHMKIKEVRSVAAPYGALPNLATDTNPDHDILFTYNGTTSGVRVPNLDWIKADRTGLTFNDATSAAFAMDMDWSKCDVTTFSWQKVLGGEGAHGMLVLSPRAVERLETFDSGRALPKVFRLTKKLSAPTADGKVAEFQKPIFKGDTINTPSMLCVEDYLSALNWADQSGGLDGLIARTTANLAVVEEFVAGHDWIDFLAVDASTRSSTSVCLTLPKLESEQVKALVALLDKHNVAVDIGAYRDAPDGLRIWCGATVDTEDLQQLMPWLKWAYDQVSK